MTNKLKIDFPHPKKFATWRSSSQRRIEINYMQEQFRNWNCLHGCTRFQHCLVDIEAIVNFNTNIRVNTKIIRVHCMTGLLIFHNHTNGS